MNIHPNGKRIEIEDDEELITGDHPDSDLYKVLRTDEEITVEAIVVNKHE
jgi:hypothetical protein